MKRRGEVVLPTIVEKTRNTACGKRENSKNKNYKRNDANRKRELEYFYRYIMKKEGLVKKTHTRTQQNKQSETNLPSLMK